MKNHTWKTFVTIAAVMTIGILSLSGCSSTVDPDAAVATLDGEDISLGAVNVYTRMQQASYESYYLSIYGEDVWSQEYSEGQTMEDNMKESVMDEMKSMYILKNHAEDYDISLSDEDEDKIEETVAQFLTDNNEDANQMFGGDDGESLKEFLELYTIQFYVSQAMVEDVDTEVSDEDATQRTIQYALISTTGTTDDDGNTVELTEDELAAKKEEAQAIIDAANESGDFESAVEDAGYSTVDASYGKDDDDGVSEEVLAEADGLSDGEIGDIVETDSGYYIVKLISENDEEATEERREEIIEERQQEAYDSIYNQWEEESDFTIDESVLATVKFEPHFTVVSDETTEDAATE